MMKGLVTIVNEEFGMVTVRHMEVEYTITTAQFMELIKTDGIVVENEMKYAFELTETKLEEDSQEDIFDINRVKIVIQAEDTEYDCIGQLTNSTVTVVSNVKFKKDGSLYKKDAAWLGIY